MRRKPTEKLLICSAFFESEYASQTTTPSFGDLRGLHVHRAEVEPAVGVARPVAEAGDASRSISATVIEDRIRERPEPAVVDAARRAT